MKGGMTEATVAEGSADLSYLAFPGWEFDGHADGHGLVVNFRIHGEVQVGESFEQVFERIGFNLDAQGDKLAIRANQGK